MPEEFDANKPGPENIADKPEAFPVKIEELVQFASDAIVAISADSPNLKTGSGDGFSWCTTGTGTPDFNVGFLYTEDETGLEQLVSTMREELHGKPFLVFSMTTCNPVVLEQRELGFFDFAPLMVFSGKLPAELKPYQKFDLERVTEMYTLSEALEIQQKAFDFPLETISDSLGEKVLSNPNVHMYVARENDEVVGTVMFVKHETADGVVESIWNMGVAKEDQKRSIGTALLLMAMREEQLSAEEAGKSCFFFLLATEAGQSLYNKVGFEVSGKLSILGSAD